jgi:hypothetical protein
LKFEIKHQANNMDCPSTNTAAADHILQADNIEGSQNSGRSVDEMQEINPPSQHAKFSRMGQQQ